MSRPTGKKRVKQVDEATVQAHKESRQLGLHLGDGWAIEAARAGAELFRSADLMRFAAIMATCHPHALDYISQAPVLVLCVLNGRKKIAPKNIHFTLTQWKAVAGRGMTLRKLLGLYAMPLPMRKIRGDVLKPTHFQTMKCLAAIPPSTLAQAIPSRGQRTWFDAVGTWAFQFQQRGFMRRDGDVPFLDWCATHWRDDPAVRNRPAIAVDMADFVGANLLTFNRKWTWQQAAAARDRWHMDLQRRTYSDEKTDASPFPDHAELEGFEFVALRSPLDLAAEGSVLHHCVASYAQDLLKGACRIISVRKGGKRHATAEFRLAMDHTFKPAAFMPVDSEPAKIFRWRLRQFKAVLNGDPGSAARAALIEYEKKFSPERKGAA